MMPPRLNLWPSVCSSGRVGQSAKWSRSRSRGKIHLLISATIIIIITRPKPAYGRQGLAGSSLRASGAQLLSGKWSFFVTHKHTLHQNIYIISVNHHHLSNCPLFVQGWWRPIYTLTLIFVSSSLFILIISSFIHSFYHFTLYLIHSLSCYIPTYLCVLDQRTLQHILFILYLYLYISTISTSYLEAHSNTYLSLIFTLGTSFSSQFLVPRHFNEVTFSRLVMLLPSAERGHSIEVMFLFRPHFISTPSALPAVRNTDVSLRVQRYRVR